MKTIAELASYLEERSMPEPNSGCRLWLAGTNEDGYGWFALNGAMAMAHRGAMMVKTGSFVLPMNVLHKCDVRCCIEEKHLFFGTQADNMADKMRKGRHVSHPGERHGRAKLTEEDARYILSSSDSGVALARRFHLSKSQISHIRSGKRWAHIARPALPD